MALTKGFTFEPVPPVASPDHRPFQQIRSPLGPLLGLVGTWHGTGFNAIWRPHNPKDPQDRFLELNLTTETLDFDVIPGEIPNRGLVQPDIVMFGVHYLQQISDSTNNAGLHLEPGIWAVVPQTTDPAEGPTVVRMASIPHGTAILAQGTAITAGAPRIAANDLVPFALTGDPPRRFNFPELGLSTPTQFRTPSDASTQTPAADGRTITQAMVDNPNSVLQAAIAGQNITSTEVLQISTGPTPVPGGGTANTDFLANPTNPADANAACNLVNAIFWIETVHEPHGHKFLQLQYTQTVMLDFNGLRWPHVTVATLRKRLPVSVPAQSIDPQIPAEYLGDADIGPIPDVAPPA
jgi:hypothetical protein